MAMSDDGGRRAPKSRSWWLSVLCAEFAQAVGFARLRGGSDASWRGACGIAQRRLLNIAKKRLEIFGNKKPGFTYLNRPRPADSGLLARAGLISRPRDRARQNGGGHIAETGGRT